MISFDQTGEIWTATINRLDKANALTHAMLVELADFMEAAQAAPAVILTGEGKVFSAGADLEEARAGLATSDVWERLSCAIAALPGLSICALNGTLAGGAMGMALACDLRIAVPEARFFYPVMKLGYLPQPSDPARLSALVGPARSKLLLMAGQKIGTADAMAFGLIDMIVENAVLLETARALCADTIAAKTEIALGIKEMCATPVTTGGIDPLLR